MCTGHIWRGIGFEIFLLPSRVHARPPEVNAKCGVAGQNNSKLLAIWLSKGVTEWCFPILKS